MKSKQCQQAMKALFSSIAFLSLASCQTGMAAKDSISVVTVESGHSYRIFVNPRNVGLSWPLTLDAARELAETEFAKRGYCPNGIVIKESWIGQLERSNDFLVRVDCKQGNQESGARPYISH